MDNIDARVRALVSEYSGVGLGRIEPDSDLGDDLGLDSADRIELAMACEVEFDIEISDDDVSLIDTVADLADCIARKA